MSVTRLIARDELRLMLRNRVAVIAFALYGGVLWGVLPSNPAISWEAHLFGFIGGLVAAALLHRKVRRA